ncbi:alanine racemase [Achromobacter sp. F4_2707]|uniref:alanine racemase n=1 Tax=Achromobacter sp. F4_2707 TaxID=3114286 RepID=UPI0039C75A6B
MPRPIMATISVPAMQHNLNQVVAGLNADARQAGRTAPKVWAVIKAGAYGHGLAQGLAGFTAADGLAMLDLDEALACREAGWQGPLMLLEGFFEFEDISFVDTHRLTVSVHDEAQLRMLEQSSPSQPIRVNLKVNGGMHRLGFAPQAAVQAWQRLLALQKKGVVGELGTMMHFSRADDDPIVTQEQLSAFLALTSDMQGPVSVCNSAATLTPALWTQLPEARAQWVRPGICLYGSSPYAHRSASELGLRPAMTLEARIIGVQDCQPGSSVGYGHLFTASQPTRVGIVACGYADGYPRHAGTGTPVTVAGQPSRLLGRVSMDMLAVDLTHIASAGVGSRVVLWGEGGPSVDEVAEAAGTVGYELLCALAPRVPRRIEPVLRVEPNSGEHE